MFSLIRASQGPKQTFAAVPSCAAVGVRTKQESAGAELGLENGKIVSLNPLIDSMKCGPRFARPTHSMESINAFKRTIFPSSNPNSAPTFPSARSV